MSYIHELGTEGRLIRLQLTELLADLEAEAALLIKDYYQENTRSSSNFEKLQELANTQLLEDSDLVKLLGYPTNEFRRKCDAERIPNHKQISCSTTYH